MKQKCNMPEAERERALQLFSGQLSEGQENEIRRLFPQYLFFQNVIPDDGWEPADRPVRLCTCTACGETFQAVRGNWARGKLHGEPCNCPQCGEQVEGKAVGKYRYDMPSLAGWARTCVAELMPDGALLIEAGNALRRFSHDDLVGEIEWRPVKRYFLKPGYTVQAWELKATEYECGNPSGWAWFALPSIREPFAPNMYAYFRGEYSVIGLDTVMRLSKTWRYCQIAEFYHYEFAADIFDGVKEEARWIVQYLGWYAEYPQIEMAVKLGFLDAVNELIRDGKRNARFLDWSANKPGAFLKTSAEDAKRFIKAGMTFQDLKNWKSSGKYSLGRWLSLVEQAGGRDEARELAATAKTAGVSFERAVHYLTGLRPRCGHGGGVSSMEIIRVWKDYLDMAGKLGYDLSVETVRLPKDLKDRHDAAAALIRHQASEAERKRYGKRKKQLDKQFAFELDGLRVIVPESSEDIVQEGKTLRHCVGGYAARHVKGQVTILFLRKSRTPGRSYLTIELCEERGLWTIRQIHGYMNEGYAKIGERDKVRPANRHKDFLTTWLDWVNTGSKRDRAGKPVLPRNVKKKEKSA